MEKNGSAFCEPIPRGASETLNETEDDKNFIIPIGKKWKIRICKPLILLKLALFIWYGAASAMYSFIFVFFKQKGISVAELATVFLIIPFVQFLGPTISGIIADKIGNSKPVLIAILLLNTILMVGIVVSPNMKVVNCNPQSVNLECHEQELGQLIAKTNCDVSANVTEFTSCNAKCSEDINQHCNGQSLICDLLKRIESNFTLITYVSLPRKLQSKCSYNISSISHRNTADSECTVQDHINCTISCLINLSDNCSNDENGRTGILYLNSILLLLFLTVSSTTYRIFDVTAMALVKEHNVDFGRQRIFGMAGAIFFSSFSGNLVTAFTINHGDKNYKAGFYLFIAMNFVLIAVIYKLKIQIKPPGKNMWKKSFYILKKPDALAFILVLIVLGSAFGFSKAFLHWYLEELGASSFLIGLIYGLNALYSLPFLFTSNWWVKTVGTEQLIICGLLGYVVQGIGYSLLYEPWISVLIQTTSIFTYNLLWVAAVVHCHNLAPEGLTATMIAMAGGIHYNLGLGAGTVIGGYTMDAFGGRMAFRAMAVSCFTFAVLYAVFLYVRKKFRKTDYSVSSQDHEINERELVMCSTLRKGRT